MAAFPGSMIPGPLADAESGPIPGPGPGALPAGFDTPRLRMGPDQYARLPDEIDEGFRRDDRGQPIPVPAAGFTDTDRFFEARGRFRIFRTCNTWISRTLRAAGLRFGIWTPTRYAVTLSVA